MQINSKIHFIGISGIGMSGIAELMLDKGYSIQGSDISVNDNTKRLKTVSYTHLTLPTILRV